MTVLVDTSGLYAVLDQADEGHARAEPAWQELVATERLVMHNYAIVESVAVVRNRLGLAAVRVLKDIFLRAIEITWVTPEVHEAALTATVASGRRAVSFVDQTSFEVMRLLGIRRAFALDPHFEQEGFELVGF